MPSFGSAGMGRMMTKPQAEKFFNRKADADSNLSTGEFLKKKLGVGQPKAPKTDDIFHGAAGTKNAGMYHPANIKDNALVPKPNAARDFLQKKKDKQDAITWEKKNPAKKTSNGIGVGV